MTTSRDGQKNPRFWIFQRLPLLPHARRHIREDFRKFSAETNDKIEVIIQKPSKTGFLPKNDHFFYTFWPKIPEFWIFPWVPMLAHASRYLREDFRKFSAKTNDKNCSY